MEKNVDLCDKLRDRRYPNSKEKRFVRWKKFFSKNYNYNCFCSYVRCNIER